MIPKHKCPECRWVGGDHDTSCLRGAEGEDEDSGSEEEWDDELEDDDDDDE